MAPENTVKHALRWMMFGKATAQSISWLVTIVVVRLLSPADYGLLAMAMVLIALGQMFRDMGLQHSLIQTEEPGSLTIRQVFTVLVVLNLTLCAVLIVSAPWASSHFNEPSLTNIIRMLALLFPMQALQGVPVALMARKMQFKIQATNGVIGSVVNSAVTLILALLDYGVWALVYGNLAAALIRVLLYATHSRILYWPTSDFTGFSSLFSFGGFITLSSFLNYLQNKSSHWFIGTWLGKEPLGIYSVSNELASLPMQKVGGVLNQVGFAAFSRIQDDRDQVRANYLKMQSIMAFFAFPTFWGIASVSQLLVPLVLGEKWLAATVPLQLISLSVPLRMLFNTTTPTLNGIGNAKLVFGNLLISSLTMPLAYYFAMDWGVNGVAATWVIWYPVLFVFMQYRSNRALGILYGRYLQAIYRPLLITAGMYLLVIMMGYYFERLNIAAQMILICQVIVGAGYYLLASYIFNRKVLRISKKVLF